MPLALEQKRVMTLNRDLFLLLVVKLLSYSNYFASVGSAANDLESWWLTVKAT